jgi:hypothetical protein
MDLKVTDLKSDPRLEAKATHFASAMMTRIKNVIQVSHSKQDESVEVQFDEQFSGVDADLVEDMQLLVHSKAIGMIEDAGFSVWRHHTDNRWTISGWSVGISASKREECAEIIKKRIRRPGH